MNTWILVAALAMGPSATEPTADPGLPTSPPEVRLSPAETNVPPDDEASPSTEPTMASGSVAIAVLGPAPADEVLAAVEPRLAGHGMVTHVQAVDDFRPAPLPGPEDRVLDVWIIVASQGPMRIVMADPEHAHVLRRSVPLEGAPTMVSLEEAAILIEETVTSVRSGEPWPSPGPARPTAVPTVVEPPEPAPAPAPKPEPEPTPLPRARRFPHGFMLGAGAMAAAVSDEFGQTLFGLAGAFDIGYAFGGSATLPRLRATVEAGLHSLRIFHPEYESYSLRSLYVESRIGRARGPVWGYAVLGLGSGVITRRRPDDRASVGAGVLGKAGAGLAIRLNDRMALRVEGEASGSPSSVGALGLTIGVSSFFRKDRSR